MLFLRQPFPGANNFSDGNSGANYLPAHCFLRGATTRVIMRQPETSFASLPKGAINPARSPVFTGDNFCK